MTQKLESRPSDIVDIRGRLAALDQGILNLQIHFQDFIDSHTQLQVLLQTESDTH